MTDIEIAKLRRVEAILDCLFGAYKDDPDSNEFMQISQALSIIEDLTN